MFRIGWNTVYDQKNKVPMKIPEFKRSGTGLIAEFCGIPNGFPNQDRTLVGGGTKTWSMTKRGASVPKLGC